jgi:F-type H+-transporting ATPase subunit a
MMQSLLDNPSYAIGSVTISGTVLTSCSLTVVLATVAWFTKKNLKCEAGRWQTAMEGIVLATEGAVKAMVGPSCYQVLPFIGTLWIFLVSANLVGLIPGFHSPTRDLSATAALAILVFFSVHWFGLKAVGLKAYLSHYLKPNPVLFPFHVLGEISRTLALAVRLFGNIMSLEMTAILILSVAGFLVPIPILMLHIIEALVQAYIFGTLALVYIAGGIQTQKEEDTEDE